MRFSQVVATSGAYGVRTALECQRLLRDYAMLFRELDRQMFMESNMLEVAKEENREEIDKFVDSNDIMSGYSEEDF